LAWLALAGLVAVAAALAGGIWVALRADPRPDGLEELARVCWLASESAARGLWGWAWRHPWTALVVSGLAGSLTWALLRLGASLASGWRMKGWLTAHTAERFTALERALRGVPEVDPARVRVLSSTAPAAFTAGLVRARIYVSAGLVETLTEAELRSVIRHEQAHATARDPLRLAAARFLSDFLWFLPVSRNLTDAFASQAELRADDVAVAAGSESIDLAAAIVKTARGGVDTPRLAPALGGFAVVERRVTRLLGREPVARADAPWGRAAASALIILGVLALLVGPSASSDLAVASGRPWTAMTEGMMDCPGHHSMPAAPPMDRCRDEGQGAG
jgi:Zn-dependent protease with chaperone function